MNGLKIIVLLVSMLVLSGCEIPEEYLPDDNNTTTSKDKAKFYDFKDYILAVDSNKTEDFYRLDVNGVSDASSINKRRHHESFPKKNVNDSEYKIYSYTDDNITDEFGRVYARMIDINDTVREDCILDEHIKTHKPFNAYSYKDVLKLKCTHLYGYEYYYYSKGYGVVHSVTPNGSNQFLNTFYNLQ